MRVKSFINKQWWSSIIISHHWPQLTVAPFFLSLRIQATADSLRIPWGRLMFTVQLVQLEVVVWFLAKRHKSPCPWPKPQGAAQALKRRLLRLGISHPLRAWGQIDRWLTVTIHVYLCVCIHQFVSTYLSITISITISIFIHIIIYYRYIMIISIHTYREYYLSIISYQSDKSDVFDPSNQFNHSNLLNLVLSSPIKSNRILSVDLIYLSHLIFLISLSNLIVDPRWSHSKSCFVHTDYSYS